MTITNSYKRPTLWQRFVCWLGFGHVPTPTWTEEEEADPRFAPGAFVMIIDTDLSWGDRLRLLITGKLQTAISVKTDAPVMKIVSKAASCVRPIGHKAGTR
jgi:hypothetical protein